MEMERIKRQEGRHIKSETLKKEIVPKTQKSDLPWREEMINILLRSWKGKKRK